eukprot:1503520-Amphidinium_carterae.1
MYSAFITRTMIGSDKVEWKPAMIHDESFEKVLAIQRGREEKLGVGVKLRHLTQDKYGWYASSAQRSTCGCSALFRKKSLSLQRNQYSSHFKKCLNSFDLKP